MLYPTKCNEIFNKKLKLLELGLARLAGKQSIT